MGNMPVPTGPIPMGMRLLRHHERQDDDQADNIERATCAVLTAPSPLPTGAGANSTTSSTNPVPRFVLGVRAGPSSRGSTRGLLGSVLWSVPVVVPAVRGAGHSPLPARSTWTTCSRSPVVERTPTRTFSRSVVAATE